MKSVELGDRVILTQASSAASKDIPLWGSKYGCVGTATFSAGGLRSHVLVDWDNGHSSAFYLYKLELYNKNEKGIEDPNLAFKLKRMGLRE